jgi:tryptophanyl-tRNA synthetase
MVWTPDQRFRCAFWSSGGIHPGTTVLNNVHSKPSSRVFADNLKTRSFLLEAQGSFEPQDQDMLCQVLSCIQPTAEIHVGNYLGAIANWVSLQQTYRCIFGIVDLHAMTMPYKPAQLHDNTERMAIDLLACGIDPEKSILFIQSLVPEHTELCWILSCVTPFGELRRMTQFKEKSDLLEGQGSGEFISAALLNYPTLQAADILVYRAVQVPVGKDQEQHLELSRVIARRFNTQFKAKFFPEPSALFTETPKVMSLADPSKKMSKSLGPRHYIGLFEDEQSIRSKVKSAVTDSGASDTYQMGPGVANLFEILKACGKHVEVSALLKNHESGQLRYSELKEVVADAMVELTAGLRMKRRDLQGETDRVACKIKEMSERARDIATETLKEVRQIVGLPKR